MASLLSSEPKDQADGLGRKIVSDMYDIFQRQREAAVQPVEKDDVAEVLRRRLFNPTSVNQRDDWPQQVIAALKGITALDEQTEKQGPAANERYLKSFPFHPELTEVFYAKWAAGIERFQKTRGVLRTFALALREAQAWDQSPLIGPAVFLSPPTQEGLSEAAREFVSIADTIVTDGQATRWTGILETELAVPDRSRPIPSGLKMREIEQAVMATLLALAAHRPQRQNPRPHVAYRPVQSGQDRVGEGPWPLGLVGVTGSTTRTCRRRRGNCPPTGAWVTGPNLTQMHAAAAAQINDDVVKAALIEEIQKTKTLSSGASGGGRPRPYAADQAEGHRRRRTIPLRRPAAQCGVRLGETQRGGQAVPR